MSEDINIMVDIETLSTRPDATIISIGAVCLETDREFYAEVSPHQNRHVDIDTIAFWFKQSVRPPLDSELNLSSALYAFSDFCKSNSSGDFKIWANGTDFDITILADACRSRILPIPWKYNSVRDYRTLAKLLPHILRPEFVGDKHNALADAKNQAAHLKLLLAEIQS